MPSDVLQQLEMEKLEKGADVKELDSLIERASASEEATSALNSIVESLTSNGERISDVFGDVARTFGAYENYSRKATRATKDFSGSFRAIGVDGIANVEKLNKSLEKTATLSKAGGFSAASVDSGLTAKAVGQPREISSSSRTQGKLNIAAIRRTIMEFEMFARHRPFFSGEDSQSKNTRVFVPMDFSSTLKLASGGFTGRHGKSGDHIPALLADNELVLNERQTRNAMKLAGAATPQEFFSMVGGKRTAAVVSKGKVKRFSEGGFASDEEKTKAIGDIKSKLNDFNDLLKLAAEVDKSIGSSGRQVIGVDNANEAIGRIGKLKTISDSFAGKILEEGDVEKLGKLAESIDGLQESLGVGDDLTKYLEDLNSFLSDIEETFDNFGKNLPVDMLKIFQNFEKKVGEMTEEAKSSSLYSTSKKYGEIVEGFENETSRNKLKEKLGQEGGDKVLEKEIDDFGKSLKRIEFYVGKMEDATREAKGSTSYELDDDFRRRVDEIAGSLNVDGIVDGVTGEDLNSLNKKIGDIGKELREASEQSTVKMLESGIERPQDQQSNDMDKVIAEVNATKEAGANAVSKEVEELAKQRVEFLATIKEVLARDDLDGDIKKQAMKSFDEIGTATSSRLEELKKNLDEQLANPESLKARTVADMVKAPFKNKSKGIQDELRSIVGAEDGQRMTKGALATGVAVYALKNLQEALAGVADEANRLAELHLSYAHALNVTATNLGIDLENLRNGLMLTREEASSLASQLKNAYREGGAPADEIVNAAMNIKEIFGALNTDMLEKATEVISSLDKSAIDALKGRDTEGGASNLYAFAGRNSNAWELSDLLSRGVFGEMNDISDDPNKQMVEIMRDIKKLEEDFKMGVMEAFGELTPIAIGASTVLSKILPLVSSIVTLIAFRSAVNSLRGAANGAESLSRTGGLMGRISGVAGNVAGRIPAGVATTAAGVATTAGAALAAYYAMDTVEDYFSGKIDRKNLELAERKDKELKDSGFTKAEFAKLDYDKVAKTAAQWGKWGGLAGGIGGGVAGAIGTFGFGTGAGAVGGAIAGTAAGSAAGAMYELRRQGVDFDNLPKWMTGGKETSEEKATEYLKVTQLLSDMNKRVEEIAKGERERRKIVLSNLRELGKTQTFIKGLEKGKYDHLEKSVAEFGAKRLEMISMAGGNDTAFNVARSQVMEMSAGSFSKNMDELSKEFTRVISSTKNLEVAGEQLRTIFKSQVDMTRTFVDAMMESIGDYENIPSVIISGIKKKINEEKLNFNLRSFSGIGDAELRAENASASANAVKTAVKARLEDYGRINKSKAMLDEKRQRMLAAATEKTEFGSVVGRRDDGTYYVNEAEREKQMAVFKEKAESAKIEIKRKYFDKTGGDFDDAERFLDWSKKSAEEISALQTKLAGMKEGDDEGVSVSEMKGLAEELYGKITDRQIELGKWKGKLGKELEGDVKNEMGILRGIRNEYLDLSVSDEDDFDNLKKDLVGVRATEALSMTSSKVKTQINQSKKESGQQEVYDNAMNAVETLGALNGATNEKFLANMRSKSSEGLYSVLNGAVDSFGRVANLNEYLSVRWAESQDTLFETLKESYMEMGDTADVIERKGRISVGQVEALFDAYTKAEKTIKKDTDKLKEVAGNFQGKVSDENKENFNEIVKMHEELNDKRVELAKKPGDKKLSGEVKKLMEKISIAEQDFKGKAKDDDSQALSDVKAVQATIASQIELMAHNKALMQAKSADVFKNLMSMLDTWNGTLDYTLLEKTSTVLKAKADFGLEDFAVEELSGLSEGMIANAGEKLEYAREKMKENVEAMLETLEKDKEQALKLADTDEEKENVVREYDTKREMATAHLEEALKSAEAGARELVATAIKMKTEAVNALVSVKSAAIDMESDLINSIGAPVEYVVELERQRVELALMERDAAVEEFQRMKEAHAEGRVSEKEFQESRNRARAKEIEVIKKQYGAQNSMLEKVFGNMIGAFGEVAGMLGPSNIASKYGAGYVEGEGGTVLSQGNGDTTGYRDRLFAANVGGHKIGGMMLSIPDANGNIPMYTEGNQSFIEPAQAEGIEPGTGKPSDAKPGAGKDTTDMAGQKPVATEAKNGGELAELAKTENASLDTVVLWEKKIYQLLLNGGARQAGVLPASGGNRELQTASAEATPRQQPAKKATPRQQPAKSATQKQQNPAKSETPQKKERELDGDIAKPKPVAVKPPVKKKAANKAIPSKTGEKTIPKQKEDTDATIRELETILAELAWRDKLVEFGYDDLAPFPKRDEEISAQEAEGFFNVLFGIEPEKKKESLWKRVKGGFQSFADYVSDLAAYATPQVAETVDFGKHDVVQKKPGARTYGMAMSSDKILEAYGFTDGLLERMPKTTGRTRTREEREKEAERIDERYRKEYGHNLEILRVKQKIEREQDKERLVELFAEQVGEGGFGNRMGRMDEKLLEYDVSIPEMDNLKNLNLSRTVTGLNEPMSKADVDAARKANPTKFRTREDVIRHEMERDKKVRGRFDAEMEGIYGTWQHEMRKAREEREYAGADGGKELAEMFERNERRRTGRKPVKPGIYLRGQGPMGKVEREAVEKAARRSFDAEGVVETFRGMVLDATGKGFRPTDVDEKGIEIDPEANAKRQAAKLEKARKYAARHGFTRQETEAMEKTAPIARAALEYEAASGLEGEDWSKAKKAREDFYGGMKETATREEIDAETRRYKMGRNLVAGMVERETREREREKRMEEGRRAERRAEREMAAAEKGRGTAQPAQADGENVVTIRVRTDSRMFQEEVIRAVARNPGRTMGRTT